MSKDKISDYSATANSNTDIGGINIDEGCAPSGINDAIRTLMKQLKDWQSGSQDVYIHPAGSASVPSITATGDTNTGLFFPAADTVGITTGGTERTRVDSSGNLGLGVTPSGWQSTRKAIQVGDTSALAYGGNQTTVGNNFFINSSGTNSYIKASTYAHIYIQGSDGSHEWYTAPNTGTAGGSASFTRLLAVNTGYSLALQGANSQTGTGITFPASQSASTDANTLDDYEEGTFTPSIAGYTTAGTGTYTTRTGRYTKIGNRCLYQIWLDWTDLSGAGGSMVVGGLPFTSNSAINYGNCPVYMDRAVSLTANNLIQGYVINGDNRIFLSQYQVGGGNASSVTLDSNAALMLSGSYEVA